MPQIWVSTNVLHINLRPGGENSDLTPANKVPLLTQCAEEGIDPVTEEGRKEGRGFGFMGKSFLPKREGAESTEGGHYINTLSA